MSDFLKSVFGGSTATQQATSTPTDMTPDAYKNLRDPLADALKGLLGSGGPTYSGPLTATPSGNETDILSRLMGMTGTGTNRSGLLDKTIAGDFLPGQSGSNPFLEAAIKSAQRPTLQGLTETLDHTLPGRFTSAGQFVEPQGSSAFDRAAAIATRGASDAMGDIATKMSYQGYNDERQLQQAAVPLSRAEVDSTISNLQAQALPRLIQDQGIDRGLALFQQRTQALLDILKTIGGISSPVVANQAQSTGNSSTEKGIVPGLFPNGMSGGK